MEKQGLLTPLTAKYGAYQHCLRMGETCANILYFPHGLDIIIDKITAFLKISSSFQVDSKGFSVSDLSTRNPKRTGVKGFLTKNST